MIAVDVVGNAGLVIDFVTAGPSLIVGGWNNVKSEWFAGSAASNRYPLYASTLHCMTTSDMAASQSISTECRSKHNFHFVSDRTLILNANGVGVVMIPCYDRTTTAQQRCFSNRKENGSIKQCSVLVLGHSPLCNLSDWKYVIQWNQMVSEISPLFSTHP